MLTATSMKLTTGLLPRFCPQGLPSVTVHTLVAADEAEVTSFLAARPLHTVYLASIIRDNGLESQLNRGSFYAARDEAGRIEGVALIGHSTLIETETDRALAAFARVARTIQNTHMIMGERETIASFWQHYSADGSTPPHFAARELLFALAFPLPVYETMPALRLATEADLDLIVPVQAELAFAESGVDPLSKDPEGFRKRCARRIAQGRTWVVVTEGRLLFKAELQCETPDVVYLEGVYVHPDERGQGFGTNCLSQLCRTLLTKADTVSLLVNEENTAAHDFYRKVGFRLEGHYDTIFLSKGQ